ncbi:MAG TPA: hypothetical protein VG347_22760 [Verrucomicrobiae bacterium]|nr:hypothetical protein [Verrucomicrobiae bacterium]
MSETIQWPEGDFTLQQAVDSNSAVPQAVVRKKLADAMAAKAIIQTKKGDAKIKGQFQVVKPTAAPAAAPDAPAA